MNCVFVHMLCNILPLLEEVNYYISSSSSSSSECCAQGQVLHCKRRNRGCSFAEGRSSTASSGTKAAVLPGIE